MEKDYKPEKKNNNSLWQAYLWSQTYTFRVHAMGSNKGTGEQDWQFLIPWI